MVELDAESDTAAMRESTMSEIFRVAGGMLHRRGGTPPRARRLAAARFRPAARLMQVAILGLCAHAIVTSPDAQAKPLTQPTPDSTRIYIERAREAAAADRHREAIDFYQRAFKLKGSLKAELGKEIGLQYTWNDEPKAALPWFRMYLAEHSEDDEALIGYARALSWADSLRVSSEVYRRVIARSPGNIDARLGEARVTAWMGDNREAERLYRGVLAVDPNKLDARLGLAQVVNWQGRHREARGLYTDILREHPGEGQALLGLAAAERWLGMNSRARRILVGIGDDKEARKMLAEMDREEATTARIGYGISRDSDKLVIHRLQGASTVFLGDLTSFGVSLARFSMRQDLRPTIIAYVPTASLYRRLNEDWSIHLNAAPLWSSFKLEAPDTALGLGAGRHSFDPFNWNGWLTWTPHRRLRVDVSGERAVVETPLSFIKTIVYDAAGAGVDVAAAERLKLRGGYDFRSYSDGNKRHAWSSEIVFLVFQKPVELSAAPGYTGFTFSKSRRNGYFNPSRYDNLGLSLNAQTTLRGFVRATCNGRVSAEREMGGPFFAVGSLDVGLESDIGRHGAVGAEFFTSNSRIAGEAGYSRILGNLYLLIRF